MKSNFILAAVIYFASASSFASFSPSIKNEVQKALDKNGMSSIRCYDSQPGVTLVPHQGIDTSDWTEKILVSTKASGEFEEGCELNDSVISCSLPFGKTLVIDLNDFELQGDRLENTSVKFKEGMLSSWKTRSCIIETNVR